MLARHAVVVVLVGCQSQPKPTLPTSTASTAPAASTTSSGDCSCEQLEAPVEVPADRERWERAAIEIDALVAGLVPLFPNGTCAPTINDEVARVRAAHAFAVRENRALATASCEGFTRWRTMHTDGAAAEVLLRAVRGACVHLSDASAELLLSLHVTRSCTRFSND